MNRDVFLEGLDSARETRRFKVQQEAGRQLSDPTLIGLLGRAMTYNAEFVASAAVAAIKSLTARNKPHDEMLP